MNNQPDFSKIFHQSSKDRAKGHHPIPSDVHDWPPEWTTTYYKTYPRLQKINLNIFEKNVDQKDDICNEPLFNALHKRESRRDFSKSSFSKKELGSLLKNACGLVSSPHGHSIKRTYPSGGARFSVEIYPIIFQDGVGVKPGVYHYSANENQLDVLWERTFDDQDIDNLFSYSWVKRASFSIIMTSVFWRNQIKYGERGYRYILLEAGHIGQNIYLVASMLGLKCCALGGTRDEELEKLLDIDGVTESVVYALAMGK